MKGIKVDDLLAQLAARIDSESIEFDALLSEPVLKILPRAAEMHAAMVSERDAILRHPLNSQDDSD